MKKENIMNGQFNRGFTLIELLITMTVAAIMLAIGVPSYQNITTSTRMSGEINSLLADMNFARSEAIKRGIAVNVCPTPVGAACSSTSTNWASGWVIQDTAPTPNVLRISPGVTHGDTLAGLAGGNMAPNGYTTLSGTVTLHNAANDPDQRRCIIFATGSWTTNKGAVCP